MATEDAHDWDDEKSPQKGARTEEIINPKPGDIKIILLGDSAVGKSKMMERYLLDEYTHHTASTYAINIFSKDYTDPVTKKKYQLDFWDTAGQEQFESLHSSYYFGAHACLLAFDVTRKVTYKNLDKWFKEARDICPNLPTICVANKIDFDPTATSKTFQFAVKNELPFFYVSAAQGTNVVRVFEELIKLAIKTKENPEDDIMRDIYDLLQEDDNHLASMLGEDKDE